MEMYQMVQKLVPIHIPSLKKISTALCTTCTKEIS